MGRKPNQAVRTKELYANKHAKQQFLLRITYLILFLSLMLWGWSILHNPNFLPLKQVEIFGLYDKTDPAEIKTILVPYLNKGLFDVSPTAISQQLQELPWVQTATVTRNWPNKLVIELTQKNPIARWSKNGLITANGEIFFPPIATIPMNLPFIITPTHLIPQALVLLGELKPIVAVLNLNVIGLFLTERQTVAIELQYLTGDNTMINFRVLLGHDEIQNRLVRFVDVFPKVFENRLNQVQYVDMRYTNGMAVKWKK